jgi:large subunit ribosomal protein L25
VPVVFINEEASPGLKKRRRAQRRAPRARAGLRIGQDPDEIRIDVTGLDVGDSIHISQVKLPAVR